MQHGAKFYAVGRDPTFPMPDGPWPATGAILAAVETAAGRNAHVIGKPDPEMFEVAQELLAGCGRCVVIGDRLDSDIVGGRRAGLATVLVLTGSTSEAEAVNASPAPDFVIPSLRNLVTGA
ncbi:MAG: HAD-IIA family hydrolase [Actinomycetota bacterium]